MNFEAEQLAESMLSGDFDASWSHIRMQQAAQRNSLFIYDRLLTEAMRYIGALWEYNSISVADEHLASAVCDRIVTKYADMRTTPSPVRTKAMLLCMEGEQHYLGLKMVASYFQESGWDTRFYGPNLPLEYALSSAMNWKPDVVALSVTMVYPLPKLTEYISTFEQLQHKPTVMVGGRLVSKYDLRPYGSGRTIYLSDMYELERWMNEAVEQQNKSKRSLG